MFKKIKNKFKLRNLKKKKNLIKSLSTEMILLFHKCINVLLFNHKPFFCRQKSLINILCFIKNECMHCIYCL